MTSNTIVVCLELTREQAAKLQRELDDVIGPIRPVTTGPLLRCDSARRKQLVFDALADGPLTYGELRSRTGLDSNGLYSVLRGNRDRIEKSGKEYRLTSN